MQLLKIEKLKKALLKSWSLESSSKWSDDNPAKGQCGVTTLVINDLLGGEIKKTKLSEGWHYYNIIEGTRFDFTASQFKEEIDYMDVPSDIDDAFSDTNESQYNYLTQNVLNNFSDERVSDNPVNTAHKTVSETIERVAKINHKEMDYES